MYTLYLFTVAVLVSLSIYMCTRRYSLYGCFKGRFYEDVLRAHTCIFIILCYPNSLSSHSLFDAYVQKLKPTLTLNSNILMTI